MHLRIRYSKCYEDSIGIEAYLKKSITKIFVEIWAVDEMAAELKMDKRNVKKRLEWWQNSGVVYASMVNEVFASWKSEITEDFCVLIDRLSNFYITHWIIYKVSNAVKMFSHLSKCTSIHDMIVFRI